LLILLLNDRSIIVNTENYQLNEETNIELYEHQNSQRATLQRQKLGCSGQDASYHLMLLNDDRKRQRRSEMTLCQFSVHCLS
jgi:hypothetical protein